MRCPIVARHFAVSIVTMVSGLGIALSAPEAERPFTAADDIALTQFAGPLSNLAPVTFSPDGRYFVVAVERGRLDLNRPESELRLYRTADVKEFLLDGSAQRPPLYWDITRATSRDGPIISDLRWTADSSSIAFVQKAANGDAQLILANVHAKRAVELTPDTQHVTGFDIRDSAHFAYSILSPAIEERAHAENESVAIVATGRSFGSAILREDQSPSPRKYHDLSELWAVIDGHRKRVVTPQAGRPIAVYSEGARVLALSPNGRSVVTALPVEEVPADWGAKYPPPFAESPYRFRQGRQDLASFDGRLYVNRFALVDLESGRASLLAESPIGYTAGWWGRATASWSSDGVEILLANTFLPNTTRPCIAVVTLPQFASQCVDKLKASTKDGYEEEFYFIRDVHFAGDDSKAIQVEYSRPNGTQGVATYVRAANGGWARRDAAPSSSTPGLSVSVKEALDSPPLLVATDPATTAARVIWNPNPQLDGVRLNPVSVYKWHDDTGREWTGGLFVPSAATKNTRYPLVLQAHGFVPDKFLPSGLYPTAFAAQEMAAEGIVVLQLDDCPITGTPDEAPCQLRGYRSAIRQLAAEGLVDERRVGIVGFSRTCYYTLAALTDEALLFQAASITDGVNEGYWQYIMDVDASSNVIANEANVINGGRPFGNGLLAWLRTSPEFKMDRVHTPLQIVGIGRYSALSQWEPYAALRYLQRPVDMIVLAEGTHLLSNPAERFASQQGTVDWMRFWLQGYEDPATEKTDQYRRWEQLCDMQVEQNPERPAFCVRSKPH